MNYTSYPGFLGNRLGLRLVVLFLFLGFWQGRLRAQTPVSGGIFSNTTWTLANSPYLMTGNVVVFPGVTLTIEPGVEVRVASSPSMAAGYYLETRGTLNMVGTPALPIKFRSDTALTTAGAWEGFKINDPQGGVVNFNYVHLSNANVLFNYAGNTPSNFVIEGSVFNYNYYALNVGLSLEVRNSSFKGNYTAVAGWSIFKIHRCIFDSNGAALAIYASSLEIDSCVFRRNNGGLFMNSLPVNSMSIRRSLFEYNQTAVSNPGNGTVDSCRFFGNVEGITGAVYASILNSEFSDNQSAIKLGFGCTVRDCDITNNQVGVGLGPFSFGQPVPVVENNRICNNSLYNVENLTDLNLYLATNCFCLSDSAQVEATLFDGYDDITRGLLSYALFDTTCTSVLRIINKFTVSGIQEEEGFGVPLRLHQAFDGSAWVLRWNHAAPFQVQIINALGQVHYSGLVTGGELSMPRGMVKGPIWVSLVNPRDGTRMVHRWVLLD